MPAQPLTLPVLVADRHALFVNDQRILQLHPEQQAELLDTLRYQLARLQQLLPVAAHQPHPLSPVVTHARDEMDRNGWGEDRQHELRSLAPEALAATLYALHETHYFAIAVHRLTGWPMRTLRSATGLTLNVVVEAPGGLLLNAYGLHAPQSLLASSMPSATVGPCISEVDLLTAMHVSEAPDPYVAWAQLAIEHLPWAPFNTAAFAQACRSAA